MPLFSSENIAYPEYRALSELRRAHGQTQEQNLRAFVVFGDLVAGEPSHDLYVLEVVENWHGPRYVRFEDSSTLPLRGSLNLYLLLPDEFENPTNQILPGETWASADLLKQVRRAYAILIERPTDYALTILSRGENAPTGQPSASDKDPLSFFGRVAAGASAP